MLLRRAERNHDGAFSLQVISSTHDSIICLDIPPTVPSQTLDVLERSVTYNLNYLGTGIMLDADLFKVPLAFPFLV